MRGFCASRPRVRALIARSSTLYGPGQDLYAEDGARHLVRRLARLAHDPPGPPVGKLFAADETTSLAKIVGSLDRIAKRRPRIIMASRPLAAPHAHALVYRSQVLREVPCPPATSLPVGIQRTHDDLLARLRTGHLASTAGL